MLARLSVAAHGAPRAAPRATGGAVPRAIAAAARGYSEECRALVKAAKGPPCFPKVLTGAEHREPSPCVLMGANHNPCFDMKRVEIVRADRSHGRLIGSFLYTHHWPRDPATTALWMSIPGSRYLEEITDRYSYTGDRFLAFEEEDRTNGPRLIGVIHADSVFPREIGELEHWASRTWDKADRNRLFYQAHLLKAPGIFKRYHVPYIYKVEVLVTTPEVQGRGVATRLLWHLLAHSYDARHPVTVAAAVSHYMNKPCLRCRMTPEWSMDYSDYSDNNGNYVFFPRRPHTKVTVYAKKFDPNPGEYVPCMPPYKW